MEQANSTDRRIVNATINDAFVDRVAELERLLFSSREENALLIKRIEEAKRKFDISDEKCSGHEQGVSEVAVADKGRKMIRSLLDKQSRLEEELKVLRAQKSNVVSRM